MLYLNGFPFAPGKKIPGEQGDQGFGNRKGDKGSDSFQMERISEEICKWDLE